MVRRLNDLLRLLRQIVFFFQLSFPWLRGAFLFTLWLMTTSLVSFGLGVRTALDRIADEWLDKADATGFPSRWASRLYRLIWVLALVTVVAGWLLLSHLTVFITRLIF